jgi:16S rRNA U516 pseudouridylate synthase RsuA-like enzyme
VAHPSSGITKEYIVTTSEAPNKKQLRELTLGCLIDGTQVQPVDVQLEASDPSKRNKIRLVLSEGKNREVCLVMQCVFTWSNAHPLGQQ